MNFRLSCLLIFSTFLASLTLGTNFPAPYNSEPIAAGAPPTPAESLAAMRLPPGFKATVFAAEPDVQNPIGMAWDARGRLWIAENFTYAENRKKFDLQLRDRILIFEDENGDGHFDFRKVFTDETQFLTSVEIGHGGVWALCPPQLIFFPDANGDDVPDSAPEVVLDGFTVPAANYHNFANGLHWGPDGWLYGRCGASAPGEIGKPGTPLGARVPIRGGIWRYHPKRKIVEVVTTGTMNPWGHDWNEFGEAFFINTVSGHLWHMIPGAHFLTAHTFDPNPQAYELINMHADHWHFDTAKGWPASRDGAANDFGGGHAHAGAMIYLATNWPAKYRGNLFTLNFHGRRANQEILERTGSGYRARHGQDEFFFNDGWFRGLDLSYGPDGGVFVLDWNDTGECHETTGVYRTSGRIYKITHGNTEAQKIRDLARLDAAELIQLHLHPNEWFARQARLQLASRRISENEREIVATQLRELYSTETKIELKLRALWSLHVIGAADEKFLRAQLQHDNEHIRTWAIRLLSDSWPIDTLMSARPTIERAEPVVFSADSLEKFVRLAKDDSSALVRLTLASTLQRLPISRRVELAAPLLQHSEDSDDHNLPLMIWYGLVPVGNKSPEALVDLAQAAKIPLVRKFIARQLGEDIGKNSGPINRLLSLAAKNSEAFQFDVVAGMAEALRGWQKATKPESWDVFQNNLATAKKNELRERARDLSVLFGDGRALDEVTKVALDENATLATRRAALETLIAARPPTLREICEKLLGARFLNSTAVRGLALFDDPEIGERLANSYARFHPLERPAVIDTLVSRSSFAGPLLDAIAARRIPRADVTAFHARQIRSFNSPTLTARLAEVWGELRDSPADKQKFISELKEKLTPMALAAADKSAGRSIFNNACAACHTLFGHGGQVGPDLTGSNRDNLDYLLENLVDPSALVTADFRMSIVDLDDDRTLTGLIAAKNERTVTLKTMTETLSLDRATIQNIRESSVSLMPEGLLEGLSETQVRDLIGYLMNRTQVP